MGLFQQIEICNQLLIEAAIDGQSPDQMVSRIASIDLHPLVKYYAYQHLQAQQAWEQLLSESQHAAFEEEARLCFVEMRNHFMRLSRSDNEAFSQLLLYFLNIMPELNTLMQRQSGQRHCSNGTRGRVYRFHLCWMSVRFSLIMSSTIQLKARYSFYLRARRLRRH